MGKKGKKAKGPVRLPPLGPSKEALEWERALCTCPNVGDAQWRMAAAGNIKKQLVLHELYAKARKGKTDRRLRNAGLEEVPMELSMTPLGTDAPENIREIDLGNNRLTSSARLFDSLSALPLLEKLDVSRNMLNGPLDSGCGALHHIRVLDMSEQFHSVQYHVNAPNPDEPHTHEDRGRVGITSLPEEVAEWHELEEINMAGNALSILPRQIFSWVHLRILNLRNNAMTEICPEIGYLDSLEELLLGANLLSNLPESVGSLRNLRHLELRVNRIGQLPQGIAGMRHLKRLHLGGNKLTTLAPLELSNHLELEQLFICGNSLQAVPDSIGDLKQLRILSVGKNAGILQLPGAIGNCERLEQLYLRGLSKLSALPDTLANLRFLQYLDAHNCDKLKTLPENLNECISLRFVDTGFSGKKKPVRKPKCKVSVELFDRLSDPARPTRCTLNFVKVQKKKGGRK